MRAGNLRHRLNLLRPVTAQNSYGEETVTWSTDKTVWGAVWPLRGNEFFQAQQIKSNLTHKCRIRHTTLSNSTKIGPKCRIEMQNGQQFQISTPPINADMRNIYLEFMCEETS